MKLQSDIQPELWGAVSRSYEAATYKSAILEAINFLLEAIRERANLDVDGDRLIGAALLGDSPPLKINAFQTETEKNEQKGIGKIIQGLYQGIRSPRSHKQWEDRKETADAIITFVNFLLGIVAKAKPFSLTEWMNRVFDPDFVQTKEYASLIVSEVPPKKYDEALVALFSSKHEQFEHINAMALVVEELVSRAGEKVDGFIDVVSEEFKTTRDDWSLGLALIIFPGELWSEIEESARLRIENKIFNSMKDGTADPSSEDNGLLAFYAARLMKHFSNKGKLFQILIKKLGSDFEEREYVLDFLGSAEDFLSDSSLVIRSSRIESIAKALCKAWTEAAPESQMHQKIIEAVGSVSYEFLVKLFSTPGIDPVFRDEIDKQIEKQLE